MKKRINWLEVLLWIVMAVLFIMILSRIFGRSATDIQIYLAFFSGLLLIMNYTGKLNREVGEIKFQIADTKKQIGGIETRMINSFKKVREDINKLQKKR